MSLSLPRRARNFTINPQRRLAHEVVHERPFALPAPDGIRAAVAGSPLSPEAGVRSGRWATCLGRGGAERRRGGAHEPWRLGDLAVPSAPRHPPTITTSQSHSHHPGGQCLTTKQTSRASAHGRSMFAEPPARACARTGAALGGALRNETR